MSTESVRLPGVRGRASKIKKEFKMFCKVGKTKCQVWRCAKCSWMLVERILASFWVRYGLEAHGRRGFPGSWKKFEERVLACVEKSNRGYLCFFL